MKEQNISNHSQIVYSYYIFTGLPILALIGVAVAKIVNGTDRNNGYLFLLIGWILLSFLFKSRGFALKAQDRAIRAEEGLRYFILTGQRIHPGLSTSQLIALRFASDDELPALAKAAADEKLSNKEIKTRIKHWRSDWYRV